MSKEKVGKEKSVKKAMPAGRQVAAKTFMEKRAAKQAKREEKKNGPKINI
jgi:hypothetical protein